MDLRDIVRQNLDGRVGHKAICDSLNVRNEIKRFTQDPLVGLINIIGDKDSEFLKGDIGRYQQAFSWYSLCISRTIEHISLARRADSELRYHPGNQKYSPRRKQIALRHNKTEPYIGLDYQNLIIYAYLLIDRTIALSRRFFDGGKLPSFTSFNKHKQFLKRKPKSLGKRHNEYVKYITNETDWHSIPLKVLRDKYLMHSSEKHMLCFGWGDSNWDLEMITIIAAKHNQEKLFENVKCITFTPRRLARDVEQFLLWFAEYGKENVKL